MIAIIPARSGSKGLVDKNLKSIEGKSLIELAVEFAADLNPDRIYLSTDYNNDVLPEFGDAVVVVPRDPKAASDIATDFDVLVDVKSKITLSPGEVVCWVRPTSPIRDASEARRALKDFELMAVNTLRSVSKYNPKNPPVYGFFENNAPYCYPLMESAFARFPRRQVLPNFFKPTAQFEVIDLDAAFDQKAFYPSPIGGWPCEGHFVDIDTIDDFKMVEQWFISQR